MSKFTKNTLAVSIANRLAGRQPDLSIRTCNRRITDTHMES